MISRRGIFGVLTGVLPAKAGAGDLTSTPRIISPEMFGAVGDGIHDDLPAFQRAANSISLTGGEMILQRSKYFLEVCAPSDVNGKLLTHNFVGGESRLLALPSRTKIISTNNAEITLGGGPSSPFGSWSTNANILIFPDNTELNVEVLQVLPLQRAVRVKNGAVFSVGQEVSLARPGGNSNGIPNTPSQERDSNQFFHIRRIDGNVIFLDEAFFHEYESVEDLRLFSLVGGGSYPTGISLNGITVRPKTTSTLAYVLFSRAKNINLDRFSLEPGAVLGFGTCQGIYVGQLTINKRKDVQGISTLESTSVWRIVNLTVNGGGSLDPLGGFFVTDNSVKGEIDAAHFNDLPKTGFACFFGSKVKIGELYLENCGSGALLGGSFGGALSVGIPDIGAYSNNVAARSAGYLRRNLGKTSISISKLFILGEAAVPIRVFDADLLISSAFVQANLPNTSAIVAVANSGRNRSDAVFYPGPEAAFVQIGSLTIASKFGHPIPSTESFGHGFMGSRQVGEPHYSNVVSVGRLSYSAS